MAYVDTPFQRRPFSFRLARGSSRRGGGRSTAMRGSGWMRPAARALSLVTAILPAAAGTPLEIHPPDGFTARQSSPDADAVTSYEVTTSSDPDTGCTVDVTPAEGATRRDQDAINAEAATPAYRDDVKASLAELFDVKEIHPFTMQGAVGAMATGSPKVDEVLRSLIAVIETPRGKVQVICVSASEEFYAWRPVFEAVVRGVTLPR